MNGAGDFVNVFLYDAIGRLSSVRQAGTNVQEKRVDIAYTDAGRHQALTRYSDVGGTNRMPFMEHRYAALAEQSFQATVEARELDRSSR